MYLSAVVVAGSLSLRQTEGHSVYALDDPYIHMAMAKNFASHGVWGVTPSHFTSSSSSPLWTLLVAVGFAIAGPHDLIPFALNLLVGCALIVVAARSLRRRAPINGLLLLGCLLTLVFATPLPALAFAGLEHVGHALLVVLFLDTLARLRDDPVSSSQGRRLCWLGAVLPLVRFESLFLLVFSAALLLADRRVRQAVALTTAAAIPLLIYGGLSYALGWYWLPNSVLLKGTTPSFHDLHAALDTLGLVAVSRLRDVPAVAVLLVLTAIAGIARYRRGARDGLQWQLTLVVLMVLAHMQYAQPQPFWFYRYEAYLIAASIVVLSSVLALYPVSETWSRLTAWRAVAYGIALLTVGGVLGERAARSFVRIPVATRNIYEQHYQIAGFLERFYPGASVALNDIGLPSFKAGLEVFDLVGLADMDVARRKRRGFYAVDDIEELAKARGVRLAVVYDSWFINRLPPTWIRVASWTIQYDLVTGSPTVTFYATSPLEAATLRRNLRVFTPSLPKRVAIAP